MRIFIDAGHNFSGADTGASGFGLKEQEITFEIANRLNELLKSSGHEANMSRNFMEENLGTTVSESLNKRCKMSNEWGADLFVSIHANAGGGKGTEVLIYSENSKSKEIAKSVLLRITSRLDMVNRGIKTRGDLAVLKNTKAPAILIETGFIDSKEDAKKLRENKDEFSLAIFDGITGESFKSEFEDINDIVSELFSRKILSDRKLWQKKLEDDKNSYYLAKKMVNYLRERKV